MVDILSRSVFALVSARRPYQCCRPNRCDISEAGTFHTGEHRGDARAPPPLPGYRRLKDSNRAILCSAAVTARDHQEEWDGSGYPEQRIGEDIHLYGCIVAVADVFDALLSTRCYQTAWEISQVVNYFRQQRGRHFDPKLTDLLLENLGQFVAIRDRQLRLGNDD